MTRCLACELAEDGIRVNAICPATVRTEMFGGADNYLTEEGVQKIIDKHLLVTDEVRDVVDGRLRLDAVSDVSERVEVGLLLREFRHRVDDEVFKLCC